MMTPITLEDIENLPKEVLNPADVAGYLKMSQQSINCAATAGQLPWAYKANSRTIIPKRAFVHYHRYGQVMAKGGAS